MGNINFTPITDGSTADAADINTPLQTIYDEFNGGIDNSNIDASAAIATSKLADDAGITTAKIADGAVTPAKLLAGTGTDWAWQSWTPTWTNLTVGSGTNEGYFTEVGKTVFYRLKFVYGSGSAVSSSPTFTLPKTIVTTNGYVSARDIIGEGTAKDASGSDYIVKARVASSTTALVILENTASTYTIHASITSTTPMTWTTSDSLFLTGFYEKA